MATIKIKWNRKQPSLHGGESLPHPVTVVVLTWNAIRVTQGLIRSFQRHPLPPNARLLFIDNGSKDSTPQYLQGLGIDVIESAVNLGYTKAANLGISQAADDVLLLNNDTRIVQPDWLGRLQATAYAADDVGLVGCRLFRGREILHAGGQIDPETLVGINIHAGLNEYADKSEPVFVTFACVYLKRSTIDRVGLLDERYFAYYEDSDYCLRVKEAGLRVVMDGGVTMFHQEMASTRANRVDHQSILDASHKAFVEKWGERIKPYLAACGSS